MFVFFPQCICLKFLELGTSLALQWLGLQTSHWIWSLVWELRSSMVVCGGGGWVWGVCVCVCTKIVHGYVWVCVHVRPPSVCVCARAQSLSHVWLSLTLWTVAHQAPLSMGFSGQEYWSGLPFPPPGHLPSPGIQPASPASPACILGRFFTDEPLEKLGKKKTKTWKPFFFFFN